MSNTTFSFSDALKHMMAGVRMAAKFMPDTIYIELQKPDSGSMNTEPYLKMVTLAPADPAKPDQAMSIVSCEPWEPGRRSLFSNDWYTSKWAGVPF